MRVWRVVSWLLGYGDDGQHSQRNTLQGLGFSAEHNSVSARRKKVPATVFKPHMSW